MKNPMQTILRSTILSICAATTAQSQSSNPLQFHWENMNRLEIRDNTFDFNNDVDHINDDEFLLNRFRLSAMYTPNGKVKFFVQAQDTRELASKRPDVPSMLGAEGDDPFDLRQCYAELGDPTSGFSVKLGRQVLLYGDQRLIGPLEWNAISRTFDAAKLHWAGMDGTWIDAFVSSVVVPDAEHFNNSSDDSFFSGIYGHAKLTTCDEAEAYLFHQYDQTREDDFLTLGARYKSVPKAYGAWDYEAEFAYQQGDAKGLDLQAYAFYAEAGYTFSDFAGTPRVSLEYSFGSGDDLAGDNKQGGFQNLYPTNHAHYGFMDAFSWNNMHDVCLHMNAKPNSVWSIGADVHAFWLADTADTWKRANNVTPVRPASASADPFAGMELDLFTSYNIQDHVILTLGYSRFFAGPYLDETGAGDDANFCYFSSSWTF